MSCAVWFYYGKCHSKTVHMKLVHLFIISLWYVFTSTHNTYVRIVSTFLIISTITHVEQASSTVVACCQLATCHRQTAWYIDISDKQSKMVLARSRPVMARYDVSSQMVKWWKGYKPTDGQVR
jgi:hypothetical protein